MSQNPLTPSPTVWLHILFGDSKGGGHLGGQGIEGKSEFPEYWSLSRIEQAILCAQENIIARLGSLVQGEHNELVDGILLRIIITQQDEDAALSIRTAFPIRGNGVFRNINGERISKPLLRQDRKRK